MKVSIFTPTHDPQYLEDAYKSIRKQDFDEWVILYNNGAQPIEIDDSRVKHVVSNLNINNVGLYKKLACNECSGDILVELDHDDLLAANAIENIKQAFEDPEIGFVYSDALRVDMKGNQAELFSKKHGWDFGTAYYKGIQEVKYPISFPPTPANVSKIWYAPDHVRAYRKTVYDEIGGHNPNLKILDDQDLMCRMYLKTKFHHIKFPLYVYRIHGKNTWLHNNKDIQINVLPMYKQYIEDMAIKWAKDRNLRCLDLGAGSIIDKRYESVDLRDADVITDLNRHPWVFETNSAGVIRAIDILEHLYNPIKVMQEISRILIPGGYAFIQVPSTDGRGAFQDPTHVSFWNENSFLYYTNKNWSTYIGTPVKFQVLMMRTTPLDKNKVCWVEAHLLNLKDFCYPAGVTEI